MDTVPAQPKLSGAEVAQYRRDGYVVVRNLLGPSSIVACKQALTDLAVGTIPSTQTSLM